MECKSESGMYTGMQSGKYTGMQNGTCNGMQSGMLSGCIMMQSGMQSRMREE